MASLLRRLSYGSRRHSAPNSTVSSLKTGTPVEPPSPNLQHLSPEELRVLGDVFNRLEKFEKVEAARISQLRNELGRLEDHVKREMMIRASGRHVDLRLCRLCFRNKFADGVGRACAECQKRVCEQCGSFTKSLWSERKKKHIKGRWLCLMCQKRRELACVSGVWFHGGQAQAALNASVFKRKVSDAGVTSDWGCSADVEQSDSSHQHHKAVGHKTDSEMTLSHDISNRDDMPKSYNRKFMVRRRLTSSTTDETTEQGDEEEEDIDVDEEKFFLERQRCRQERLLMQHRKSRRRQGRKSSVGTCTREDGVLPEALAICPRHFRFAAPDSPDLGRYSVPVIRRTPSALSVSSRSQDGERDVKSVESAKTVLHPRVRELTVPTGVGRKLSAPARIHDDRARISSDAGSADSGSQYLNSANVRNRSRSMPGVAHFRRSSSEGDHIEFASLKQFLRASSYTDAVPPSPSSPTSPPSSLYRSGKITTSIQQKQQQQKQQQQQQQQRPRVRPPGRSHRAFSQPLVQLSTDSIHERRLSNQRELRRFNSPESSIVTTSSKDVTRGSLYPKQAALRPNASASELRRLSSFSNNPTTSKRSYSSAENVQKMDAQWLKVPLFRAAVDEEDANVTPAHVGSMTSILSQIKRNSDDSQDDLMSRRASDSRRRSSSSYRFRVVLHRDPRENSRRTMGLGMRVVGGKQGPDNKLGAFVTWLVSGGPADMAGIAEGDQILEWNGRSLVDATFEEVQQILASSGDTVQLIVMHTRLDLEKRTSDCYKPPPHWRSKLSVANGAKEGKDHEAKLCDSPTDLFTGQPADKTLMTSRVNECSIYDGRLIGGRIQLKLLNDTRFNMLVVTLMQVQGLSPRPTPDKEMPSAYAKFQLVPDLNIKSIKTEPAKNSRNPEWMKTVEIANFDQAKIQTTTLLVTVWDWYPDKTDVFLGEVLLDLKNADLQNKALWYRLSEHDENTGQLMLPTPKLSRKSYMTSGDEGEMVTDQSDSSRLVLALSDDNLSQRPKRTKTIGILKKRVSEVAMKVGALLVDKRTGQVVGNAVSGKNVSRTNSQSSNTANTTDNDEESLDTSLRPTPEGDDVTSMLGPGQVPPKPSLEKLVKGDIKLGFMITKGQLEVDVICGKGLSLTASKQPPDTYVKTYLVGGGKRLQKRKTKTVKACTDPLFAQKLKYSACNVHGRYMQILIKEKAVVFERNHCLGEVVVKLDQLDLSSYTMGWYKLFRESAVELGSCESLAW